MPLSLCHSHGAIARSFVPNSLDISSALAIAGAELFHDLEKLLRSGFVQEVEFGEKFVGGGLVLAEVGDEELEFVGDEAPDGGLGRGWAIEAAVGLTKSLLEPPEIQSTLGCATYQPLVGDRLKQT